jgi:hypothetical protein
MGMIHGTTAVYSLIVRQGFGHIVNIAFPAGLIVCPMNMWMAAKTLWRPSASTLSSRGSSLPEKAKTHRARFTLAQFSSMDILLETYS